MIKDGSKYADCINEQTFKMKFIKNELKVVENDVFCIETEETVKGFPDVMVLAREKERDYYKHFVSFFEFKISDKNGRIHFQPTQPSFYRQHKDMPIIIVALNRVTMKVHEFPPDYLFSDKDEYKLSDKAEVNLSVAEKGDEK